MGDDFVEFYLSYPSRKVKVEAVSREGVRYGVTTYQISPEEVNQLKYQPRMHDFRKGTYHLEVWDGSRIRSEDFRVTGWTENPLYEVYQFFYNVFGRNPYKITALLVDWASTSPSQYSFLYLIAGGILCMYVIGIFLSVIWDIWYGKTRKS